MADRDSPSLDELAVSWRAAKRDENAARDRRLDIEERIIGCTGVMEEGSTTHDAGEWKVRVTGKLTRKLDAQTWKEIEPSIPEAMRPVEYVPRLELKGLRYLENNEPEVYRKVCRAIETKPAKPSVEVK